MNLTCQTSALEYPNLALANNGAHYNNIHNDYETFIFFYQSILTADNLEDFEINLFSFMYQVLQQRTCLLYLNIDQKENQTNYTLQRGSYSEQFPYPKTLYDKFPTSISIDVSKSTNPNSTKYWYEPQIKDILSTRFFSVVAQSTNNFFIYQFQKFQEYIRCGMLLTSNSQEVYGILIYERPLCHPVFNAPVYLQQFQTLLSLALDYQKERNYATFDQLTQLHHKYYFLKLIKKQLDNQSAIKQYQLLIIDVDFFKKFNDTYGHLAGDQCLYAIAKIIKASVRTRDFTGRFGGEEFVCFAQSDLQQAKVIAERIHQAIKKIELYDAKEQIIPSPTVSIGITSFRQSEQSKDLIERADQALYRAKQNGRNQTVIIK